MPLKEIEKGFLCGFLSGNHAQKSTCGQTTDFCSLAGKIGMVKCQNKEPVSKYEIFVCYMKRETIFSDGC
jgi:hypothetical protein